MFTSVVLDLQFYFNDKSTILFQIDILIRSWFQPLQK